MAHVWIAPSLGWLLMLVVALGINSVDSPRGEGFGKGELMSGILLFTIVTVRYIVVVEWHRRCLGNINHHRNEVQQGNKTENQITTDSHEISNDPTNGGLLRTCNSSTHQDGDLEEILDGVMDETTCLESTKKINSTPSIEDVQKTLRLPYLDNVKSLLTAMVVTFHCSCSFGGCGDTFWLLILGYDDPSVPLWFERVNYIFVALCQSFFMPLFFFISAYFCPTSYERQGPQAYLTSKRKRLLLPLVAITFTLVPACWALAQSVAGRNLEEIKYIPMPAHGWFLLWLLLFNWVYHSYCAYYKNHSSNHNNDDNKIFPKRKNSPIDTLSSNDAANSAALASSLEDTVDVTGKVPFPKTWKRWLCGGVICGLLMLFLKHAEGTLSFGTMPLTVGSLTCDLFMFWMGVQAQTNDWLDGTKKSDSGSSSTLRDKHMDISPCTLWCFVFVEAAGIVYLLVYTGMDHIWHASAMFTIAGIYCLDMSLAVLDFFQHYVSFENKVTLFLSQASYGVFLIHPAVVVGMTSVYIWAFNTIFTDDFDAELVMLTNDGLKNLGTGGGKYSPVGWLLVTIASHLVVWPLAYGLKQLPVLEDIL